MRRDIFSRLSKLISTQILERAPKESLAKIKKAPCEQKAEILSLPALKGTFQQVKYFHRRLTCVMCDGREKRRRARERPRRVEREILTYTESNLSLLPTLIW